MVFSPGFWILNVSEKTMKHNQLYIYLFLKVCLWIERAKVVINLSKNVGLGQNKQNTTILYYIRNS